MAALVGANCSDSAPGVIGVAPVSQNAPYPKHGTQSGRFMTPAAAEKKLLEPQHLGDAANARTDRNHQRGI